jgi:hypothetical protein
MRTGGQALGTGPRALLVAPNGSSTTPKNDLQPDMLMEARIEDIKRQRQHMPGSKKGGMFWAR